MDRAGLDKFYKENVGLVHAVARKCAGRLAAIGMPMDYDDIVQELSLVFVKAYDCFDETKGAKFSTYFTWSAYNKINNLAKRHEDSMDFRARSAEEMSSLGEGEEMDPAELIADSAATPEEALESAELFEHMMGQLSPLARTIAEMTANPPEFIERELEAAQAHVAHARTQGVIKRVSNEVNMGVVCAVIEKTGVGHTLIVNARREISNAFELTYE